MAIVQPNEMNTRLFSLERNLSQMVGLVQNQLQRVILAYERRDVASARQVVTDDERVDEFFVAIDAMVLEILGDAKLNQLELRRVISIMKISGELERVGDLAKNIGKRINVISTDIDTSPNIGVARMGRASLRQLSDILDAYATDNLAAAEAVWAGDDELDNLYNSVFGEVLGVLTADSTLAETCVHLVFIAKNFERVGDHATNIAEAIYFVKTGNAMPEPRPKSDRTASALFTEDGRLH